MPLIKGILISLTFLVVKALDAQEPSKIEIKNINSLNFGLGIGMANLYDESFSLVRQIGLGPTFFVSFNHINEKSSHLLENTIAIHKFKSEVSNVNYALTGENFQERFNYTYLHNKKIKNWILSAGASFAFDFSQIKPEGLVINNSPLHDFNLQLQLATMAVYPFEILKKKLRFTYHLNMPFVAYNSRPDYLGFIEFSGKSKYFNKNANFTIIHGNYFYMNQILKLGINSNSKNSYSIQYHWYYANNQLSNLYQNLTNTFLVTYTRILISK